MLRLASSLKRLGGLGRRTGLSFMANLESVWGGYLSYVGFRAFFF